MTSDYLKVGTSRPRKWKSQNASGTQKKGSLAFSQGLIFIIHHRPLFCVVVFVCSYNKLEDDFQSEADPLRAYNDYLEDVENISKS